MKGSIKTSPEIRKVVNAALGTGQWSLENGSKHQRIRHVSGRMVTFAGSSGDRNGALCFAQDIRRVEQGIPGWGQRQEVEHVVNMKGKAKGATRIQRA